MEILRLKIKELLPIRRMKCFFMNFIACLTSFVGKLLHVPDFHFWNCLRIFIFDPSTVMECSENKHNKRFLVFGLHPLSSRCARHLFRIFFVLSTMTEFVGLMGQIG